MYSYLEISQGYGKKRRSVAVSTTIDTPTIFDTPRVSIPFGEVGSSEYGNEGRSSSSFNLYGQSNLFPTGSTNPPNNGGCGNGHSGSNGNGNNGNGHSGSNGNGNNGNGNSGGNNGNGQTGGQNGNGNSQGNGNSGSGSNGNSGNGNTTSGSNGNGQGNNKPKNLNGTLKSLLSVVGI